MKTPSSSVFVSPDPFEPASLEGADAEARRRAEIRHYIFHGTTPAVEEPLRLPQKHPRPRSRKFLAIGGAVAAAGLMVAWVVNPSLAPAIQSGLGRWFPAAGVADRPPVSQGQPAPVVAEQNPAPVAPQPQSLAAVLSNPAAPVVPAPKAPATAPERIRVDAAIEQARLIQQPQLVYPPLAKAARIQGAVRFNALIAKDGRVERLDLVSGHPLLVPAALDAVKQWVYRPTLVHGEPVEVETQVEVKFVLRFGQP